jgi:hypothetical protein
MPFVDEIISPADAFRLFLCARYRRTTLKLAGRIDAYWLTYSKRLGIPPCVKASAEVAIERLRQHVKKYDIRLRGQRVDQDPYKRNPIALIDRIEQKEGELDVFEQTLGHGIDPAHTVQPLVVHTHVYCLKSDVMKIVEEISKESFFAAVHSPVAPRLKGASDASIRAAIASVYDDADKGGDRPNINKLPGAVAPRLKASGYKATGRRIKKIGIEFAGRRGAVRVRLTKAVPE